MARMGRLQGCYRRVLIFLLVIAAVILAAGIFLYQRLGGFEGARYWMAERALNGVEAHLLEKTSTGNWRRKPDGVSEEDARMQFEKARDAIVERRVNLIQLDRILSAYQAKFQKSNPSTGETIEFLRSLEYPILPAESQ